MLMPMLMPMLLLLLVDPEKSSASRRVW